MGSPASAAASVLLSTPAYVTFSLVPSCGPALESLLGLGEGDGCGAGDGEGDAWTVVEFVLFVVVVFPVVSGAGDVLLLSTGRSTGVSTVLVAVYCTTTTLPHESLVHVTLLLVMLAGTTATPVVLACRRAVASPVRGSSLRHAVLRMGLKPATGRVMVAVQLTVVLQIGPDVLLPIEKVRTPAEMSRDIFELFTSFCTLASKQVSLQDTSAPASASNHLILPTWQLVPAASQQVISPEIAVSCADESAPVTRLAAGQSLTIASVDAASATYT